LVAVVDEPDVDLFDAHGQVIVVHSAQGHYGVHTGRKALQRCDIGQPNSMPFPVALAAELSTLMVGKGRDDLVFVTPRDGVLRVSTYRKRFFTAAVETCQAADESFPAITPHDLRHTAASLAISAGANVKAVERMLGHAKASMTLDVYADLFDDDLDSVANRLDAAIKSAADSLRTNRSTDPLTCASGAQNVLTFSTLTNMPCPVWSLLNRVPASVALIVQPCAP
jgi:hypothetical protein